MKSEYQRDMSPWPALARYGRMLMLPAARLNVFLFDSDAENQRGLPLLLLVHGLADEADTWRHLIDTLAQRYRVMALDLPGFGRSAKPRRSYSLTFYIEIIREILDATAAPAVTLAGHSLGGIICHAFTLMYTQRVKQLALIDGCLSPLAQRFNAGMLRMMLPYIGEHYYNSLRRDPQAAYDTLRGYYADLDGMPAEDRRFLFQRVNERVWNDGQRDAYFSVLRAMPLWMLRRGARLIQAAGQLNMPTSILWGADDVILPLATAHALLRLQPAARLTVIPKAGHLPHQERPDDVLRAFDF